MSAERECDLRGKIERLEHECYSTQSKLSDAEAEIEEIQEQLNAYIMLDKMAMRKFIRDLELEQLKQTTTMSAIDTAIDKIIEEKNDAIAKMEWWRKEAERWRAQALDLDAQVESAIATMTTRMDRIERQLKQFTDIDL